MVTQYRVPSGATVSAEGSWAMSKGYGFHMSYNVNFEGATVDYDLARGPKALQVFRKGRGPRTVRSKAKMATSENCGYDPIHPERPTADCRDRAGWTECHRDL